MSALQWALFLQSGRHVEAVEAGVEPLEVLRGIQIELAVMLAAQDDDLRKRVQDPYVHVLINDQLKLLRSLVRLTIDMMTLDPYRGRDCTSTDSLPSPSIQNESLSRNRFKNRR